MINRFSQFLVEEQKTVYFTFGRMNPPTIGHGKLLDVLAQKAGRNPYRVYASQSQDKNKNPLHYKEKVKYVRKMFPKHARSIMINNKVKTAIDALVTLYDEGFVNVTMVVGSDRVREFDILLNKYNGKTARHGFYNFKKISVLSAGERDPDAEGVEGMSASKQRDSAKQDDFITFSQGLPKSMSNADAKRIFNSVRKGMGLKEQNEFKRHIQLQPVSETREKFIEGKLFNIGEQVIIKKTDEVGTISVLGSNYVIVETSEGKTRQWLEAVEKIEPHPEVVKAYKKTLDADDQAADYNHRSNKARVTKANNHLSKKIKQHHPDLDMKGKITLRTHLQNMKEANQPEWGTPESTKKAKEMTPGQEATTPQDKDIADRPGSQPARYHKGLSKSTKIARDRHFKAKKKGPAPGDANAKTFPSKNTKFIHKLLGEQPSHIDQTKAKIDREKEVDKKKHDRMMDKARMRDTKVANMAEYGGPPISRKEYLKQKPMQEASFADKSKASGISVGTLKKVYNRGVAAWKTGHRPGTTPQQWGHARVNAFIRKKKQGGLNHDKDLA